MPEYPTREPAGSVLQIIGISSGPDGSGYHRMFQPFKELADRSRRIVAIPPPGKQPPAPTAEDMAETDVFVVQRPIGAKGMRMWDGIAGATARVYEIDDDLLHVESSGLAYLVDDRIRDSVKYLVRRSEMVTCSTPHLAEVLGKYNPNVRVLQNVIHEDLLKLERPRRDHVVVGWEGGASHLVDMCVAQDPLRAVLDRNPQAGMHFIGVDYSPLLRRPCRWTIWSDDVWDFYAKYDFDVAIAPLADVPFNHSKCVDSSMRISTNRGVLEAGSLEPGMKVWRDGWRKIEAAEKNDPKPGLLITMESGYQLKLTAEHRMLVNGDWVQADAIVPGDRIAMEAESIGPARYVQVPWPADSRRTRGGFNADAFLTASDGPKLKITPRWGRILGAFVGDGSVGQSTQIDISCDGQDQDWIDLLVSDFEACGFQPHTDRRRKFDGTYVQRRRFVRVASAHLLRVLESLGLTRVRPSGRPIRVTRIPEIIWQSPQDVVAEFLAAYFEADGNCTATGLQVTSKDERLIRDTQRLLLGFGITSTVVSRVHSDQNGYRALYWHCSLRRAEADLFAKHIGFRSARKSQRLTGIVAKPHSNAYRPVTWSRAVLSVEPCTVTPVDIQVEGSTFVLAGFVSHNSHLKALDAAARGVPIVAQDLPPYRDFVRDGETGYLVRTEREWEDRLHELINDEAARAEMGAKAKAVAAEWTIQKHWTDWQSAYEDVAAGR